MSRRRIAVSMLLLAGLLAGCGGDPTPAVRAAGSPSPAATDGLPDGAQPVDLDPATTTPHITNPWFPVRPRTRWIYRESSGNGDVQRVVVTASTVTRRIANGVTARVVRDTVTLDGTVIEDTFDWYAQDAEGTVWYLGEDTAEFEDGEPASTEGFFEAGVDRALPGVIMPAEPAVGMTYRQEYAAGSAEDNGEVLALGRRARVPAGAFTGCLQTADTNALEPDVLEQKYYARGVGVVLTVDVSEGGREELVATSRVSASEARRAGVVELGHRY